MLSKSTALGLILTLPAAVYSHNFPEAENPQITTAPSVSEYTSALAYHSLLLERRASKKTSTSLGSADALSYCQESVHGCSYQLTLYDACSAIYGDDLKYLYCLCTTGYHDAVSACDACSVSLGAMPASWMSEDVADGSSQCVSMSSKYGTDTHASNTKTTKAGSGGHGSKTTTAAAEATSVLPSSTTSTFQVSMPTEPYAGLAGQPTIPGDNGVAAATSSGAAATNKGVGVVAGMVLGLGGAVLL